MSHSDTTPRTLTADRLGAAFNEVGGQARPDYLPDIVAQAGRTRQRPAWTFLERWLPMDIAVRRQGVPRAVLVFAVLALLITLLVATVAFIGTRPSPPPLGAATNGLIAFAQRRRHHRRRAGRNRAAQPDQWCVRSWVGWRSRRRSAFGVLVPGPGRWDLGSHRRRCRRRQPGDRRVGGQRRARTIATGMVAGRFHDRLLRLHVPTRRTHRACARYENGDFCASRIFVAAADGSGARQIGDPALDARSPDWSPDGSTIAFGGGNASPAIGVHLYLMDADGSNVRQLSDVVGSDWAFVRVDWSHDGTKIVGQAGATDDIANWDIWVINADGSGATNVGARPQGGDEVIPSWAPDRDALAWWADGIILLEEGAEPVDLPARRRRPCGPPMASSYATTRWHRCDGPRWHRPDDRRRPRG